MTSRPLSHEAPLTLRAVRREDLNAMAQFIYDICEAEGDTSLAVTPEDLDNEWKFEGFDPGQDAFLLETPGGRLTGYGALFDISEHCEPERRYLRSPAIQTAATTRALLRAMDTWRAQDHIRQAPPGERVFIRAPLDDKDEAGKAVLVAEGYSARSLSLAHGDRTWRQRQPSPGLAAGLEAAALRQGMTTRPPSGRRATRPSGIIGAATCLTYEEFSYYNLR